MDKLHKRGSTVMTKKHSEIPSTTSASRNNNERSDVQELVIEGESSVISNLSAHLKKESKLLLPAHDEMRSSVKPAVSHRFCTYNYVNQLVTSGSCGEKYHCKTEYYKRRFQNTYVSAKTGETANPRHAPSISVCM